MLVRRPPQRVARLIGKKLSAAWHDLSARSLDRGERRQALSAHLHSLFLPDGKRYLSYSRHVLAQFLSPH
jgi:hypothetical protein